MQFDVQLLGDADTVVSELCRRLEWNLVHERISGGSSLSPESEAIAYQCVAPGLCVFPGAIIEPEESDVSDSEEAPVVAITPIDEPSRSTGDGDGDVSDVTGIISHRRDHHRHPEHIPTSDEHDFGVDDDDLRGLLTGRRSSGIASGVELLPEILEERFVDDAKLGKVEKAVAEVNHGKG